MVWSWPVIFQANDRIGDLPLFSYHHMDSKRSCMHQTEDYW